MYLAHHEPESMNHDLSHYFLNAAGGHAKTLFSDGLGATLPGPVSQLSSSMLTNGQDGFRAGLGVGEVPAERTAATSTGSRPNAAGIPVMPQAGCAIAEGSNATAEGGDSTAQSGCTEAASGQAQLGPATPWHGHSTAASQGAAVAGDHAMPEHAKPPSAVNDDSAAKGTTAVADLAAAQAHPESTDTPQTGFSLSAHRGMSTAEDNGDSPDQALNSALQQLARDQRPEIAAAADNIRAAASAATAEADAAASQPAAATAAGSLASTQLNCNTAQCRAATAGAADTSPPHLDAALANGDITVAPPPATADEAFPIAASTPSLHARDAAGKEEDGRLDQAAPEAHLLASATVALDLSMTDLQFQDDSSPEPQGD